MCILFSRRAQGPYGAEAEAQPLLCFGCCRQEV